MERPNAWKKYDEAALAELEDLCGKYRAFISENKTERECVTSSIQLAEAAGYVDLAACIAEGRALKAGDKVYAASHNKTLMLVNLGSRPMEQGMNILGAHIDSPRLDLKQNPLYEAGDMAYLDTHYYGGVKAYHWVATPLALHGVICKKDGMTVEIAVGEDADDPVFCISDLLIHLASEQMEKPAGKAVDHENLDVIVAGRPVVIEDDEEAKEPVKQMFLDLIKEKYDIDEEDFLSAEDIMDEAGVDYQTCELGRIGAGGGGTIAYILAEYGMDVIDSGVAVLSMHALWEVTNKADVYEAYKGYKAFITRA